MTTVELPPQAASDSRSPFDAIKQTRPDGSEFWSARAIQTLMGYVKWQRFEDAIARAKVSTDNCGRDADAEFVQVVQLTDAGNLGVQERKDYELSRYAAYTLAMNGEPSKPEVALAQGYFVNQTWFAETVQSNPAILAATTTELGTITPYEIGTLFSETRDEFTRVVTVETVDTPTAHALAHTMQTWAQIMAHQIIGTPLVHVDADVKYANVTEALPSLPNGAAYEGSRLPDFRFTHPDETNELITWAAFAKSKGLPRCGRCGQGLSRRIMYAATACGTSRGRVNGHNVFSLPAWEVAWELHGERYTERHNDPARNHNGVRA